MIYNYPHNSSSLIVQYRRTRIGPNAFMVFYKNISSFCFTSKEVRQRFGSAKFTEGVKTLSTWCDEMIDKYGKTSEESLDMEQIAKEGFGPEAHLDETDPNYQTKMVM